MTRATRLALFLPVLALVVLVGMPLRGYAADEAVTPDVALRHLQEGNQRFVDGKAVNPNSDAARRQETATEGQYPSATILGCSDSRVPLARVFDQGVGDIFVVRVAGNVAGPDELGSIEYGVGHLHTPLLVVLGHTKCGAVAAAVQNAPVEGALKSLIGLIAPAVARARQAAPKAEGDELLAAATKENVWQGIADALTQSAELREHVSAGKLKVVGAIYDLETGKVTWLGEHPEQARLIQPAGQAAVTNGQQKAEAQAPVMAGDKK